MKYQFDNNFPIYMQLVDDLKMDIISGKMPPGEKLLSIRDLALNYKVNPNTVQKALIELEKINLIYTERTNGKYVTKDNQLIAMHKELFAKKNTQDYLENMNILGYSNKEIINYLNKFKGEK